MAPIWPPISILIPTFMNGHRNSPLKLYAITKYPWKCFRGSLGAKICEFKSDVNVSTRTALNIKFRVMVMFEIDLYINLTNFCSIFTAMYCYFYYYVPEGQMGINFAD